MKEYKIEIKIKNNLILRRIFEMGYPNVNQFCKAHKLSTSEIGSIINMKKEVTKKDKITPNPTWISPIVKLAGILGVEPEDIISEEQKQIVDNKKCELYFNYEQINNLLPTNNTLSLEHLENEIDNKKLLSIITQDLRPKEIKVLELRFGLNGEAEHTLEETAIKCTVTRERIRQIELKALRRARWLAEHINKGDYETKLDNITYELLTSQQQ